MDSSLIDELEVQGALSGVIIADALGGGARRADAMVPPSSWAFDATAALPLAYDVAAAKKALADAGWKQVQGGGLAAPGQTEAYAMEILSVPAQVNPATNALALSALLDGQTGPYRDIVLLNAAAAFIVAGRADDLKSGVRIAAEAIDGGKARQVLDKLIAVSNG